MINIYFNIAYYTLKIEIVSAQYCFYYNFCEIEQKKLHLLILYIKCVSVFWYHVVSVHGAATTLNRKSLSIFLFLFVYIIFCLPVHKKHKHYLLWEHIVSAHGSATDLNRESLGVIFCSSLFIIILFLPVHEKQKTLSCLGARCVSSWSIDGL